jgi:Tfp pilus assembly protein PilF
MATRSLPAALAVLALAACAGTPSSRERQSAEIHQALGMEALRAGRAQDALREFDQALEVDDRYPDAWLGKALVLERAFNKDADAERAYRRALELNPNFPEAWTNLGQLLARQGRTEEALKAFDAALAEMSYREPWVARINKGLALYRAGRRDEGLVEMKACLRAQPAYCGGHRLLGSVYLEEGKVREAIEEFSSYVRHCEKVADAHALLGQAHMKAGDADAARADFERCSKLGLGTVTGEECIRSLEQLQ